MLGLLILALLQPGRTCAQLAGHYFVQGEDGRVAIDIRQARCDRIAVSWKTESEDHTPTYSYFPLDGLSHQGAGPMGFGAPALTTARIVGDTITMITVPKAPSDTAKTAMRWSFWLARNGDLCARLVRGKRDDGAMWAPRGRARSS